MGYITGSTCDKLLNITFTEKGKEYLSGINPDKNGLLVKFFTLGDSDINYNTYYKMCNIPDLTGTVDCVNGTKCNAIRYEIIYTGSTNNSNKMADLTLILNKICCS